MHQPRGFSRFRNRIVSPALRAIADHWQQVRADKAMPAWSDLSPTHLGPHLKLLWSFRYDQDTKDFTARLAGDRVMRCFGQSFRGTPLKDLHPPHVYQEARANMARVVSEPAFAHCSGNLFKIGIQFIEGERIMFPLASDGQTGDSVLGASDFKYRPASGEVELLHDRVEWFPL
jgi:hypothetical protein